MKTQALYSLDGLVKVSHSCYFMKAGGNALYGNLQFFLFGHICIKKKVPRWCGGLSEFLSFYYFLTNRFSFKPPKGLIKKVKKVKSVVVHCCSKSGSKKNEKICICKERPKNCLKI